MVSNSAERGEETWVQPVLEGMSDRELLEGYTPDELIDYREYLLIKYSDIEKQILLTNDALDGYGVVYGDDN